MRVIDGVHRVLAAKARGQLSIEAEFFDGGQADAFLRAVEANVSHGLPLSQEDRRAAADRILRSHPHLSDRAIGRVAGLGTKAVAALRRNSAGASLQPEMRLGRDGRVRPVSGEAGRQRVAEIIAQLPQASLREVARLAGVSPATVSAVRRRLVAGESPQAGRTVAATATSPVRRQPVRRTPQECSDPAAVLEKLVRDPSLRHKAEGRQLLRLLRQNAIGTEEWSELTAAVPAHCGELVVDLARQCAEIWLEFAQEVDARMRTTERLAANG
ncbi:LacI family DNA-binding transcriptional regulator [Kitasatospora acidiphila]|uniref:LacI family DNA-binding transcriptional regulator n=2 Tax=Kitasatospora acidiphila TaxID=2567942 RepID=A0A540WDY9_9ACTN|nr:LacI family DNA-binding transcriptional regulator [Kitasatospora acidiphila]